MTSLVVLIFAKLMFAAFNHLPEVCLLLMCSTVLMLFSPLNKFLYFRNKKSQVKALRYPVLCISPLKTKMGDER